MPDSGRDRMNCQYELVFLLVKSRYYWFDLDPIRIPHATVGPARGCRAPGGGTGPRRPTATPATRRHRGDGKPSGTHPGSTGRLKYGMHTREVAGARRYGTGRRSRGHPHGRNPGDVWSIPTRPCCGPHFAAFPLDLPARCIQAGCKPGGMVLDPFCGTGTTGLAALALGRHFTGIEFNPAFAALAAQRLRHAARPGTDAR